MIYDKSIVKDMGFYWLQLRMDDIFQLLGPYVALEHAQAVSNELPPDFGEYDGTDGCIVAGHVYKAIPREDYADCR